MKNILSGLKPLVMQPIVFGDIKLVILDILRAEHGRDFDCPVHHHPWYEFNYVKSGSFLTTLEGTEFKTDAGQAFLIPPGCSHSHRAFEETGDDGFCLRFDMERAGEGMWFDAVFSSMSECRPFAFPINIKKLKFSENILSDSAAFVAWLFSDDKVFSPGTFLPEKPEDKVFPQVMLYISEYYKEKIRVEQIAAALHMSYRTLSRRFKEETGITVIEALNEIRIRKAKSLLVESDKRIYEIALEVGFENEYYFSNVFRKYSRMSPGSYRNNIKKLEIAEN